VEVIPAAPTRYVLKAISPSGGITADVFVNVVAPPAASATARPGGPDPPAEPPPTPPAPKYYEEGLAAERAQKYPAAAALYRQAAATGDVRAMFELGKMYRAGQGVTADAQEAGRWFRKAAEGGHLPSMVRLGAMHVEGVGVAKDYDEAVRWIRKAAEASEPAGMDTLGVMYSRGIGLHKDDAQAVAWFRKAAEAGNPSGMYHLAVCYEKGTGVGKDSGEATRLFRLAANAGDPQAKARLAAPGAVHVAGNRTWTGTGLSLKAGDMVTFAAAGSVRPPANLHVPPVTAAGTGANCTAASPAPRLPCWSLIGRIGSGGPVFAIGINATVQVRDEGELYLGINQDAVAENTGAFRVTVRVEAK
jgi:hypothetical protein